MALPQQFLEMMVARGRARVVGLTSPQDAILRRECPGCGQVCDHLSHEFQDGAGATWEVLTCYGCRHQTTTCVQ